MSIGCHFHRTAGWMGPERSPHLVLQEVLQDQNHAFPRKTNGEDSSQVCPMIIPYQNVNFLLLRRSNEFALGQSPGYAEGGASPRHELQCCRAVDMMFIGM